MTRFSRLIAIATLSALVSTVPVVAHGAPDVYVVKNGDSLSHIAGKLGVRLADLLRVNDLSLTSVIVPGQRLDVPGASTNQPSAAGAGSYTVSAGDALSVIASRHGISLAALLSANNLTVNSVILPGQRLTIPGGGTATNRARSTSGGAAYTVRSGDALGLIAARHDVSLAALLSANNLTVNSVIHPGQRLTIPGGTTTTANQARSTSGGAAYTVRSGDALGLIAARHDVSLAALLSANNLSAGSVIHPGDKLTVPAGATGAAGAPGASVQRVLNYALAQVGKPYRFFSAGPYAFDCSGLTLAAYARVGIDLLHHSASQARQGSPVDFYNQPIKPGDLVFISTNGSGVINHVGIAVNNTSWVQARRPGVGVRVTAMPADSAILAVRRFLPAN